MSIHNGFMADPLVADRVVNRGRPDDEHIKLDPRVFNLSIVGSRLLVVRDEAESQVGGIIVPDTVRVKNPPGAGWVIGVGNTVGAGSSPHPHGVYVDSPEDLLYKRIIFGMYSGSEFVTGISEGGYTTRFWIMTDRDVWMIDYNGLDTTD